MQLQSQLKHVSFFTSCQIVGLNNPFRLLKLPVGRNKQQDNIDHESAPLQASAPTQLSVPPQAPAPPLYQ